jgi:hypothetical protein
MEMATAKARLAAAIYPSIPTTMMTTTTTGTRIGKTKTAAAVATKATTQTMIREQEEKLARACASKTP